MIDTHNPSIEFNALDRCDRCGAQAYASASKDGLELLFCLHDIKKHSLALETDGWVIGFDYESIEQITPPEYIHA